MKRSVTQARNKLYAALELPEKELRQAVKVAIVLLGPTHKRSRAKPRDPARSARRTAVRDLDALCRKVVFARDEGKCRKCGKPAVDWSHVYTRAIHSVRWDLDGSFASCKGCHLRWHHRPAEGVAWWESEIGGARMASLALRASGKRGKPNHEAVRHLLEQEAARLGVPVEGK